MTWLLFGTWGARFFLRSEGQRAGRHLLCALGELNFHQRPHGDLSLCNSIAILWGRGKSFFFFNAFLIYLFIYFFLCWVFVSVRGLSLVAASGGHSSSRCTGLSLSRPLLLRSTGSRRAGSVVVAHEPSCSVACGIFPDQGSNLHPLHWQADSPPLRHQGSPREGNLTQQKFTFSQFWRLKVGDQGVSRVGSFRGLSP